MDLTTELPRPVISAIRASSMGMPARIERKIVCLTFKVDGSWSIAASRIDWLASVIVFSSDSQCRTGPAKSAIGSSARRVAGGVLAFGAALPRWRHPWISMSCKSRPLPALQR